MHWVVVMPTLNPEKITLTSKEAQELKSRIKDKNISDDDVSLLLGVLAFYSWIQDSLATSKLTIKRLKKLFGFKSEVNKNRGGDNTGDGKDDDKSGGNTSGTNDTDGNDIEPLNVSSLNDINDDEAENGLRVSNWDNNKNHGRYGAGEYTGCEFVFVPFEDPKLLQEICIVCEAKTFAVKPKIIVILDSKPLISGIRYALQQSRCSICLECFIAPLPAEITGRTKYNANCVSSIAIFHYYAGLPFKRIEMLQQAQGVPLADSTQFDKVNEAYVDVFRVLYLTLEKYAAQGENMFLDDTPGKIIQQIISNKAATHKKDTKAVHATAMLVLYEGNTIYLFKTDTNVAGKSFKSVIEGRASDNEFITMSDASSHNFPELDESLMAKWIICLCLAHSRRKFVELVNDLNDDEQFVINLVGNIYHNDKYCKDNNLTAQERLEYHKKNSASLMDALKVWLNNLLLFKTVEPNSLFGQAISYMLKRWYWLTQFLRVAGAPVDNNICEQAIKVLLRYKKNSQFYRTLYGAFIGDAMMSLLHTTAYNKVNIFNYLTAVQEHASLVNTNPDQWMPWCYEVTMAELPSAQKIESVDTG